jgi:hypothetical protein
MAIRWFNIRSKEVVVAETEPQISALWASSDHSPNITQGQDFGWRLAPEVVVKMKQIKQDFETLTTIARRINKQTDEVTEPDIIMFISETDQRAQVAQAEDGDYTDEYEQAVRDEEEKALADKRENAEPVVKPIESLEDLQKRVELEERLAAARAGNNTPAPTVTTTTTKVPTTTTTTTKKA